LNPQLIVLPELEPLEMPELPVTPDDDPPLLEAPDEVAPLALPDETPPAELPELDPPSLAPEMVHIPCDVVHEPSMVPFVTVPEQLTFAPLSVPLKLNFDPDTFPEFAVRPPGQLTAMAHPTCWTLHVSFTEQPMTDQVPERFEQVPDPLDDEQPASARSDDARYAHAFIPIPPIFHIRAKGGRPGVVILLLVPARRRPYGAVRGPQPPAMDRVTRGVSAKRNADQCASADSG
jgi:hypothetical protein